ncbi:CAP domain-containing protein [Rhodopirellula sp. P2]|uniref:CAP domain-containing protein n=1 Tax=Rhodopirellula sp. P2 TaxID=2127060 RepID=UPI0023683818|nr:CAP domain-containing protein [Rhodopirellula sp. P2]WDQ18319.1 CAP domain-containing protein [Rhodopirellula sp. P2]
MRGWLITGWLFVSPLMAQEEAATVAVDSKKDGQMVTQVEKAIVKQINDYRVEKKLGRLEVNDELQATAKKLAEFMAESGKYGHHADGKTPAERAEAAGYEYCVVRENIAYRTNTEEVTAESLMDIFVQGWIDSPPHHENIVAKHITQTGAAVATADQTTYYAVHLFGRPKSAQIEISVLNRSGKAQTLSIETNESVDEIEMPSRTTVSMKRCFPTTFRIDGLDAKTVDKSSELILTEEGWEVAE